MGVTNIQTVNVLINPKFKTLIFSDPKAWNNDKNKNNGTLMEINKFKIDPAEINISEGTNKTKSNKKNNTVIPM